MKRAEKYKSMFGEPVHWEPLAGEDKMRGQSCGQLAVSTGWLEVAAFLALGNTKIPLSHWPYIYSVEKPNLKSSPSVYS